MFSKSKISRKLVILLILTSILPLFVFGIVAITASRRTTVRKISEDNMELARRSSSEISLYMANSKRLLSTLVQMFDRVNLSDWA